MKALSVGVVGAGDIAHKVHLPVLLSMAGVTVPWIFDANAARCRSVAKAYGLPSLDACAPDALPACDVALLAIPVGARGPYYETFSRLGTAVFAEKPFAVSAENHRVLAARFEPHRLACGYMRRFYSSTRIFRDLVRMAPFGALRRIRVSEGNRSTASRVDRSYIDDSQQSSSGGILSELGCHSLDVALFVTGARAYDIRSCEFQMDGKVDRKVTAQVTLHDSDRIPLLGVELDYCVSWLDRQSNIMVLEFDHCSVWAETHPGGTVRMGRPDDASAALTLSAAAKGATTSNQAFFLQWQDFLHGYRTQTESDVSANSALLGTTLIEALYAHGRNHA